MNRRLALPVLVVSLMGLVASTTSAAPPLRLPDAAPPAVTKAVDAFVAKHTKAGLHIRVGPKDMLRIHCPIGVRCDKAYAYRAVKHTTRNPDVHAFSYLSFSTSIIGKLDATSLQNAFGHMYAIVRPAELVKLGWDVRLDSGDVFRKGDPKFTIVGYSKGRLQARLKTTVTRVGGHKKLCAPPGGRMPAKCMIDRKVSIPMTITFDVPVEDGVLDCKAPKNRARCG